MTAPRLEINLDKIFHNTRTMVGRLSRVGISVTGISKATLGSPEIAGTMLRAGAALLGDSRIENIERLRNARVPAKTLLTRSPMLSQVARVAASADISLNTEQDVISGLSTAAGKARRTHGVVLMVELGDLREGIMPADLESAVRRTLRFPHINLEGIGTNLACRSGVVPDAENMAELSSLAMAVERAFDLRLNVVSGGNSANIEWALSGAGTGRVNNLRLGESLLLGREPLNRQPIAGLSTDAFTLIAEVIESGLKPSKPRGTTAQCAYGRTSAVMDRGNISQGILAMGLQDVDVHGLLPPEGIEILGASSDHLVVDCGANPLPVGAEVAFQVNYGALVGAMTSPFVAQVFQEAGVSGRRSPVGPFTRRLNVTDDAPIAEERKHQPPAPLSGGMACVG